MAIADKVQQSVSLTWRARVQALAEARHYSALVDKLASSTDPNERKRIKEELARLTFGE